MTIISVRMLPNIKIVYSIGLSSRAFYDLSCPSAYGKRQTDTCENSLNHSQATDSGLDYLGDYNAFFSVHIRTL